jgi:hypothetical protein
LVQYTTTGCASVYMKGHRQAPVLESSARSRSSSVAGECHHEGHLDSLVRLRTSGGNDERELAGTAIDPRGLRMSDLRFAKSLFLFYGGGAGSASSSGVDIESETFYLIRAYMFATNSKVLPVNRRKAPLQMYQRRRRGAKCSRSSRTTKLLADIRMPSLRLFEFIGCIN